MNTKIGKCIDCDMDAEIAGRCNWHYWRYRSFVNKNKNKAANNTKTEFKKDIAAFFSDMDKIMPVNCEECGTRLPRSPVWMRRATMAHILPKRKDFGFPSVATNADNIIFLCPDCHTNMDNLGANYAMKMKCLPLMKERVKLLIPLMTEQEVNRIPAHLL